MATARRPAIVPTSSFSAILAALAFGAAFGATSSLLPLIKLNAIILTAAVVVMFLMHAGLMRGLFTNLGVSMISGLLAVVSMWAVWYALEYGHQQLLAVLQQGVKGILATLDHLSHTTTVTIRGASGSSWTHGPDEVRLMWIGETLVMGLAPVLGALVSPIARRRKAAARA